MSTLCGAARIPVAHRGRYRGFEITMQVQPRGHGEFLLMIDVHRGGEAWAQHRDAPAGTTQAAERAALAQATAFVDGLAREGGQAAA